MSALLAEADALVMAASGYASCPVDAARFDPATPYEPDGHRGKPRRFCSRTCARHARNARAQSRYAYTSAMRKYAERLAGWEDEQANGSDFLPGMPALPKPEEPVYVDPYP